MAKDFSPDPIRDFLRVSVNPDTFTPLELNQFTPIPTEDERRYGEINRYFVRFITHKSPSDIIEVDKSSFQKSTANPFYQSVEVRWKIAGSLDDLPAQAGSVRFMPGVISANKKSVELASEEMPGLKEYITDYKRFWRF